MQVSHNIISVRKQAYFHAYKSYWSILNHQEIINLNKFKYCHLSVINCCRFHLANGTLALVCTACNPSIYSLNDNTMMATTNHTPVGHLGVTIVLMSFDRGHYDCAQRQTTVCHAHTGSLPPLRGEPRIGTANPGSRGGREEVVRCWVVITGN